MKCPKCPGRITESKTKSGETYGSCMFCKGVWISLPALPKIFKTEKVVDFVTTALKDKVTTAFKCSYCSSSMQTGQVENTELQLDECVKCNSFYFDRGEMDELLSLVGKVALPVAQGVKFDTSKMVETQDKCPVCKTEALWSYAGKEDRFKTCRKCNGILSSVEVLAKIAHHSLFGPTMFTFRQFSGEIKKCRSCKEEQKGSNSSCQKCGRELTRAKCFKCKSDMSEYSLHDTTIERCQVCNAIWLDPGELEEIMTLMPDMRKSYEEGQRKIELDGAVAAATAVASAMMIDNPRRKFLDNSPLGKRLGPFIFFFY